MRTTPFLKGRILNNLGASVWIGFGRGNLVSGAVATEFARVTREGKTHMDYEAISAEVKTILISSLGLPFDPLGIKDDEPLWGGRFNLGSMAAIEILSALEDHFGVQFPDEKIDLRLFGSVRRLADAVSSLLPDATSALPHEDAGAG
jgi:acyl carrier protein